MKKMLICASLLLSTLSFAENIKISDTKEAISVALEDFTQNETSDVTDKFQGVKAWPTKGGIKVKVYLPDSKSMSYFCHRHEADEPFECHKQ